jgi:hypothetical protein
VSLKSSNVHESFLKYCRFTFLQIIVPKVGWGYNRKKHIVFILKWNLPRTTGLISIKLGTKYPWVKEIQNCSNKEQYTSQRRDNTKNIKIGQNHLKVFSRTMKPEKLRFAWKPPDMVYIFHIMVPRGRMRPQLGKSYYICLYWKIRLQNPHDFGGATIRKTIFTFICFGNIFSRTRWPISIKIGTKRFCMKRIQVCSNKGPSLLQER